MSRDEPAADGPGGHSHADGAAAGAAVGRTQVRVVVELARRSGALVLAIYGQRGRAHP